MHESEADVSRGRLRSIARHDVTRAAVLRGVALVTGVAASVIIARVGGAEVKGSTSAFAAANALVFSAINFDLAQQVLRDDKERGSLASSRHRVMKLWFWYAALGALCTGGALLLGSTSAVWICWGALAYLVGAQSGFLANGISGPFAISIGAVLQQVGMAVGAIAVALVATLDTDGGRAVVIFSYLLPVPLLLWAARVKGERREARRAPASYPSLVKGGAQWQPMRVSQLMLLRIDLLVVIAWLSAHDAGIYSVGLSTASLAGLVPAQMSFNTFFTATQGRPTSLRSDMLGAGVSGLVGSVVLAVVGWPLIVLLYGDTFSDAYFVMLATLPGITAYSLLRIYTNRMRVLGKARSITIPSLFGVAVMAVALVILVPTLDIIGAGIASSLGAIAAVGFTLWRTPPADRADLLRSPDAGRSADG